MPLHREATARMEASAAQEQAAKSMEFALLCSYLEKLEKNSHSTGRRSSSLQLLHRLLEAARSHGDLYAVVRLLIPKRDVERQHYNMKENALAVVLMDALAIGANSKDGMLLSNWKRTSNFAAGDFTGIVMQVISRRQGIIMSRLSVADINSLLDRLARSSKRKARVDLLKELLSKCATMEIKWFIRIIFKDMKIGLGENTILDTLHEDARAMMATCVDLKHVCTQLHDHNSHPFRKELNLGKVLKCQHSKRMNSVEAAWLAMKRSEVVAECKFDGDRMQVHRDGPKIWFWSRNGKEHPEYTIPLGEALCRCLSSERCVLDGELLVWDVEDYGFKARTKTLNHDAARAARKGLNTNHRVCYVIFDILYEGNLGSLMHFPLKKRREILKQVVHPDLSPQIFSTVGEGAEWAIIPTCLEELENFFWQMVEKGNEGIVVKSLGSQWAPDNRDGRWCKIKPDYVFVGSDLDLLIIGGYFGTGSRGGKIASFLLALVDESGNSTRFLSICRCGQGLSEEEFGLLESKLSPYIIQNGRGSKPPPACGYLVTNSRYECPDVWISRPEMSIVLQISSEKRIYPTQSFKAGWTFRFPRIVKVRYDKCWKEALHVQEFEDIIRAAKEHGNSMLHGPQRYNQLCQTKQIRKRLQVKKHQAVLPHLQNLDVSHVEQVDSFFKDLIFYICSSENSREKETLQTQIKRSGGRTAPNFVQSVTHIVACEAKGFHFQVAVDNNRDIICLSWVSECIEARALLPLSPRHYLSQSPTTKKSLQMFIDAYGDPWFEDVNAQDLRQVLKNINGKDLLNAGQKSRFQLKGRKLSKNWYWDLFESCHLYFHKPVHSVNPDSQMLARMTMNRLQLEAGMLGASTSTDLSSNTTHVIIYVPSEVSIPTKRLLQSFKHAEKVLLQSPLVNIVGHVWLEECVRKRERLCIKPYLLSKGDGAIASNHSEAVIKVPAKSISSKNCMASDSNHQQVKRKQCSSIAQVDLDCDNKRKRPCKTGDSTHQPVKKKQRLPLVEEDLDRDNRPEKTCKRYLSAPKCSLWGETLKEGNFRSLELVNMEEHNTEGDSFCQEELEDMAIQQDDLTACNASPMPADRTRSQCNSMLTMSEVIWESECLQDIAQVYLGSCCEESSFSAVDNLLDKVPEPQVSQSTLVQDNMKEKQIPSPTCIPKRRFTSRDWL